MLNRALAILATVFFTSSALAGSSCQGTFLNSYQSPQEHLAPLELFLIGQIPLVRLGEALGVDPTAVASAYHDVYQLMMERALKALGEDQEQRLRSLKQIYDSRFEPMYYLDVIRTHRQGDENLGSTSLRHKLESALHELLTLERAVELVKSVNVAEFVAFQNKLQQLGFGKPSFAAFKLIVEQYNGTGPNVIVP